jgi:hypothetical protein
MRGRPIALSQKEPQRGSVISSCAKGDIACLRAAALLSLTVRQVKRLKKRLREQGDAPLAHANVGRPSPRRLPIRVSPSHRGRRLTALGPRQCHRKNPGAQFFPPKPHSAISACSTNGGVAVASRSPFSAISGKDNASRSPASSRLQLRHGDIIHVAVMGIEPCCDNTLS